MIPPAKMPQLVEPSTSSPKQQVWSQINNHENGWIVDILERPILIWGAQGSYKSYFAAYLALLRMYLKGHSIEVNDPHLELNRNKAWKALIEAGVNCYGSRFDYAAIADRIDAFISRLKNATDSKKWHSPIFDEITQYAFEADIKDVSPNLIIKCLSDCRKGREAPILLAHNNTQALTGGSSGTHKAFQEGLVQLHLFSTSKSGEYHPLFRGELTGLPNSRGEFVTRLITIDPDWMNPDYLLDLSGLAVDTCSSPIRDSAPTPGKCVSSPPESNTKETVDLKVSDSLVEPLWTIWLFAKEQNDWVTVRQIMRKNFAVLKGLNSDRIRQYLGLLCDMGFGEIESNTQGVMFKAF